jgi:hypothetical protein
LEKRNWELKYSVNVKNLVQKSPSFHLKHQNMKKTLMLIALTLTIAITSNAQSTYPIQDTLASVAPHLPAVYRYTGTGKPWYNGLESTYTHASQDTVDAWIAAYPVEATVCKVKINNYLIATDPTTLSSDEAELYKDLHAIWLMIHAYN